MSIASTSKNYPFEQYIILRNQLFVYNKEYNLREIEDLPFRTLQGLQKY